MSNLFTAENYIMAWSILMSFYAVQMLLTPAKMVTDHFSAPTTPMLEFFIRGSSGPLATMIYCANHMSTDDALNVALASTIVVGVLYPFNAKFGLIQKGLNPKYPMHYVPEAIMTILIISGGYIKYLA